MIAQKDSTVTSFKDVFLGDMDTEESTCEC